MKKLFGIFAMSCILLTSCTADEPIDDTVDFSESIVGTWNTTRITKRIYANGIKTIELDSAIAGSTYIFTSSFYVYADLAGQLDTSRYNFNEDTLYFIKNAVAFDTAVINHIDASNLFLASDINIFEINGNIIKEESVINFTKQ